MKNWILGLSIAGLATGIITPIVILTLYFTHLSPDISHDPSNWGNFGSVISGAFTLFGSFATLGTLLFLYSEKLESDERQAAQSSALKKQVDALTFEQFLNHRRLFLDRLAELTPRLDGLTFSTPEKLYNKIFPDNRPTNCEYHIRILPIKDAQPEDLSFCIDLYNRLNEITSNPFKINNPSEIIDILVRLHKALELDYDHPPALGDILFLRQNFGINIYDLSSSVAHIGEVLNSLLFYTGNAPIRNISLRFISIHLQDEIFLSLTKSLRELHGLNGALAHLHAMKILINEQDSELFEIRTTLPVTLVKTFSDKQSVQLLDDAFAIRSLTNNIGKELAALRLNSEKYPEVIESLDNAENLLDKILQCLDLVRPPKGYTPY